MSSLDNLEIARVFDEIAELMELKGENPFKVRAYDKAARALRGLTRPVRDLQASGELLAVPGIGKAIAEKIAQMLAEGRIALHEQLASEFPPQILELMSLNGLGPKKAAMLYRELGIGSVAELEAALKAGRVQGLKGFGAVTEAKLLQAIAQRTTTSQRVPIGRALELAYAMMEELRKVPGVHRLEAAGSLRRRRETVGDLDILCTADAAEPVMDAFCATVAADKVLMRGPTRSSLCLAGDFQVDLRVVPPESFGAALQYFTGSKDHNVQMRLRAERRGLKLNEYGLFDAEGRSLAGREEEDVYRALDLPWIPPELRETGEEVELAARGALPRLVDVSDVRGNLHTHSNWSDGTPTLEMLALEAARRGLEYLAVTDHSPSLVIANGLSPERLRKQRAEIEELNARGVGATLLCGAEVDILPDGSLDHPDEVLAGLDVVVASVHSSFGMGREEMTRRVLRALENPHVDILGHPSGRLLGRRDGYELDWEALFQAAARTRTALEINCSPNRLDLRDLHARRAAELGVTLSLGTDAHHLDQFAFLPLGVGVARRAGLEPERILNTRSLADLRRWLEDRT